MTDSAMPRLSRVNAIVMVIEGAMFVISTSFLDSSTVIAVFTNLKTGSNFVAGIAGALVFLCPLIGTILMGNLIDRLPHPGRVMTIAGILSRLTFVPLFFTLVFHASNAVQVFALIAGYGLFYFGDGFVSLIWTDILARTQPVRRRMVIHSIARVFGGAAGFFVALFIRNTLASSLSVDTKFTAIFGGACVCLAINAVCLALIRDDPARCVVDPKKVSWRAYFSSFAPLWKKNAEARHTIVCKALYQLSLLTAPLNLLFCTQYGHVTQEAAAALVFMPISGLVVGGFLWAYLAKRFGYRPLMLATQLIGCLCASLSLVCLFLAARGVSVLYPMGAVILLLSCNVGGAQGYNHHLISIVSQEDRAHYLVLLSILTAPFTLGSILAGFLADQIGYIAVYLLFAFIAATGLYTTLRFFFSKSRVLAE